MPAAPTIVPLVCALLLAVFAAPGRAQAQPPAANDTVLTLSAGQSKSYKFADTDTRWPDLLSTGASKPTVKWTCVKANSNKVTVSPQMYFKETLNLADQEQISTRKLTPKAFALVDFCATHQLDISNAGPGTLTVK
jgi:hypothetical protein